MEQDIIINYTGKDNEAAKDANGWVSDFSHFLGLMLTQVLGRKPVIVLKTESSALSVADLEQTNILISIISPDFTQSGQCLDAVEEFYKVKEASSIPTQFKVLKSDVPYEEQPAKLRDSIPYDLFDIDYDSGHSIVFDDYFGPAAENVYWMKMVDLAYDVHETLMMLAESESKDGIKPLYERETIFLAETGQDLNVQRNVIRRELQRHGFRVLPDHTLPRELDSAVNEIKELLAESTMSVHLIGNSYGEIPAGGDRSLVDMENKLAAEKVHNNPQGRKLQRMIWINPNQDNSSDQQKAFIENIQRDLTALEAAEIFQIPLEDFKNTLREELFDQSNGSGDATEGRIKLDEKKRNAYLIYDQVDQDEAIMVGKELTKAGVNVLHTDFDGNVLDLRKYHQEKLRLLDVGIVFKGKVNDNWVRMKILDLMKAPGLGRNKPILGKAVVGGLGVEMNSETYKDLDLEILSTDRQEDIGSQIDKFIKGLNKSI